MASRNDPWTPPPSPPFCFWNPKLRLIHAADRSVISAANFLELSIVIENQIGPEAGRQCDVFFRRAGVVIEPFTVEQAHIARQAFLDFGKGRHAAGLNFGDCFAYALAKITGERLHKNRSRLRPMTRRA